MTTLRELIFEPCPYCHKHHRAGNLCYECDDRGFFLRDTIADGLGDELLEAVAEAEEIKAQRDKLCDVLAILATEADSGSWHSSIDCHAEKRWSCALCQAICNANIAVKGDA